MDPRLRGGDGREPRPCSWQSAAPGKAPPLAKRHSGPSVEPKQIYCWRSVGGRPIPALDQIHGSGGSAKRFHLSRSCSRETPAWEAPMFEPCACGSGKTYAACCGRLHAGAPAGDAEALMRSRYSAFARGDRAYLLKSWARGDAAPRSDPGPGADLDRADHRASPGDRPRYRDRPLHRDLAQGHADRPPYRNQPLSPRRPRMGLYRREIGVIQPTPIGGSPAFGGAGTGRPRLPPLVSGAQNQAPSSGDVQNLSWYFGSLSAAASADWLQMVTTVNPSRATA